MGLIDASSTQGIMPSSGWRPITFFVISEVTINRRSVNADAAVVSAAADDGYRSVLKPDSEM